jgi:HEAT repeat protein
MGLVMHCSRRGWFLILVLTACLGVPAPLRADAVDDLRVALDIDDVINPTDAMLEFRRQNLQKHIDVLKSVGQLRRALSLDQWRDDPSRFGTVDDRIRFIDMEKRTQVGKRLAALLEQGATSNDANNRLAVANVIAEMGPAVRALNPKDRGGFARGLAPVVERLAKDRDLGVRQEGLRALGSSHGRAKETLRIFADVLKHDPAPGPRRVAADGLAQQVRIVSFLAKPSRDTTGVEANRAEVLETLIEVIGTSPLGYKDADRQVRALSAEAFHLAAQTLTAEMIPDVFPRKDLPPLGRTLTAKEKDTVALKTLELVHGEKVLGEKETRTVGVKELQPVLTAVREQVGSLAPLLSDPEPEVRLAAMRTLASVALARQKLRQRVLSLPNYDGADHQTLLAGVDPLETFLQRDLGAVTLLFGESDLRLRKAAVAFLMLLEERALPLADLLIVSLTDPERSIRWMAARALGSLPPSKITSAVPNLAKLLNDPDLDLRMAAAATLEGMGPHARAAVGAMAQAVTQGDAEGRIAVMHALNALGPNVAQAAVPHLSEVLGQRDVEPKVLIAAAQTLAEIGGPARRAVPALRRLIGHDDAEVRSAASEAILAINGAGKK